ncbi:MAG: alpha/beta hydrolase [Rhodocyclaceae bacterium]|nr:MAG: alpha/beta hydrolase [Rhodocyclaceae bacterium]
MTYLTVQGHRIEVVRLPSSHPKAGYPSIVFLHEGLGSVAMWRDFPQQVADATGCEAVVYSRYSYGKSDPLLQPHDVRYMHKEGLEALPELLDKLALEKPILFGHSDGASIALINAGGTPRPLTGVIVMAPHVMVEDICISSIEAAKVAYDTPATKLRERLAKFHADVDSAFRGWNDIWLHPEFRFFNIEEYLPNIPCPVLAIQGEDDEYGTMDQIERIARQAKDVELVKLADCRHSPHKDQPAAVLEEVTAFVQRLMEN